MADNILGYDDSAAVKFIQKQLSAELNGKLTEDEIIYFVDLIYDYYDSRGFFDEEENEEDEIIVDIEELTDFVIKNAKRDDIGSFSREEVASIIEAEMDYCDTVEL